MTPGQHLQALAYNALTAEMQRLQFWIPLSSREALAAAVVAAVAGAGVLDGEKEAGGGGERSDAAALAGPLRARDASEGSRGLPADRGPVVVAVDHRLDVGNGQLRPLLADVDEQQPDALGTVLGRLVGLARLRNLGQKLIHHVAHALIFGDCRSASQVMHGIKISRMTRAAYSCACVLLMM